MCFPCSPEIPEATRRWPAWRHRLVPRIIAALDPSPSAHSAAGVTDSGPAWKPDKPQTSPAGRKPGAEHSTDHHAVQNSLQQPSQKPCRIRNRKAGKQHDIQVSARTESVAALHRECPHLDSTVSDNLMAVSSPMPNVPHDRQVSAPTNQDGSIGLHCPCQAISLHDKGCSSAAEKTTAREPAQGSILHPAVATVRTTVTSRQQDDHANSQVAHAADAAGPGPASNLPEWREGMAWGQKQRRSKRMPSKQQNMQHPGVPHPCDLQAPSTESALGIQSSQDLPVVFASAPSDGKSLEKQPSSRPQQPEHPPDPRLQGQASCTSPHAEDLGNNASNVSHMEIQAGSHECLAHGTCLESKEAALASLEPEAAVAFELQVQPMSKIQVPKQAAGSGATTRAQEKSGKENRQIVASRVSSRLRQVSIKLSTDL